MASIILLGLNLHSQFSKMEARFIADSLKAEDQAVNGVVATTAKTVATLAYNIARLFKLSTSAELARAVAAAAEMSQPPTKRIRHDSGDCDVIAYKSTMNRDGKTSITTLHFSCGVRKYTNEQLQDLTKRYQDIYIQGFPENVCILVATLS